MEVMNVYRTFELRRSNQAWWQVKKQKDGTWSVHMHADFVPRTDWTAVDDADLFAKIAAEMAAWIEAVKAHFAQLAKSA